MRSIAPTRSTSSLILLAVALLLTLGHGCAGNVDRPDGPERAPESATVQERDSISLRTMTIEIEAMIDGRDLLVIKGNTLQWHHKDWAAVGRHDGMNEPTMITATRDGSVELDRVKWIPDWPDKPPAPIREEAKSSVFKGLRPPMPRCDVEISLIPLKSRGTTRIHQHPSAENDYALMIEFDDPAASHSWYKARIVIETGAWGDFENARLLE